MDIEKLDTLKDVHGRALAGINAYCGSIRSRVSFTGHVEYPGMMYFYPCIHVGDPLGITINIISINMEQKKEIIGILAKNGVVAKYRRCEDTGAEFEGMMAQEGEVRNEG